MLLHVFFIYIAFINVIYKNVSQFYSLESAWFIAKLMASVLDMSLFLRRVFGTLSSCNKHGC